MADKNYKLSFEMSDGTTREVMFTAPQGPSGMTVDLTGAIEGEANPINADTLGGKTESMLSVANANTLGGKTESMLSVANSNTLGGKTESQLSVAKAVNSDTLGGKTSAYYAPATKLTPRNLLDNSYFINPVNQRCFESGTAVPAWGYFIDRWTNGTDTAKVFSLHNEGVELSLDCNMTQYLTGFAEGKTLTFAVGLSNGKVYITSGKITYSSGGSWKQCFTVGTDFGDLRVVTMNGKLQTNIENGIAVVTVAWAALYEGEYTLETLPEYQPKGYAAEFVECQRYYQQHYINFTYAENYVYVPISIPMRVIPSAAVEIYDGSASPDVHCESNFCIYAILPTGASPDSFVDVFIKLSADL